MVNPQRCGSPGTRRLRTICSKESTPVNRCKEQWWLPQIRSGGSSTALPVLHNIWDTVTILLSGSLREASSECGWMHLSMWNKIFGVYTHWVKRFELWWKMLFTSEHFSYALSMITSESGQCLAWKIQHPNTFLYAFQSDVTVCHQASFLLKQMQAFNLRLIDRTCSSCLSSRACGPRRVQAKQ